MKKVSSDTIKYLLITLLLLSGIKNFAQQNSLFNTYVYDPFQLNIAYAGHACTEANIHYRTQWLGTKDAPTFFQVNAHTALGKSNGIGLRLISQQIGLLNNTQATLGYAYRFRVSATADVHLGLGIGWTQSVFNAQKAIVVDANDVTLVPGKQKANGFDSEFGVMYLGQKLKAGVSVLHLYNTNPTFAASNYKLLPQSNLSVSYVFNKGKKVELEPCLVDRYTLNGTNTVEGILNVNFLKILTVGAGYRSNYGVLGFAGVKAGNLKIAYSFDYGVSKNATVTGSSHQVLLGFNICKNRKPAPKTEPEPVVITNTVVAETNTPEPVKEEVKQEPKEPKEEPVVKEEPKKETNEDILAKINALAEKVVFDLGKSKANQQALFSINAIAKLMREHPTVHVNIIGHTCNKGEAESNKILSAQRAAYVKSQLIKNGVNSKNIHEVTGVGAQEELFSNSDESVQSKNRTIRFELAG